MNGHLLWESAWPVLLGFGIAFVIFGVIVWLDDRGWWPSV